MASAWLQLLEAAGINPPTEQLVRQVLSRLLVEKEPARESARPSTSATASQPSEDTAEQAGSASQDPRSRVHPVATAPVGPVPLAPPVVILNPATAPEGPVPLAPYSTVPPTPASGPLMAITT